MTTVMHFISKLGAAGIKLWLDDEHQLRFKAPKGALNAELKAELIAQKETIIAFLKESKINKAPIITTIERNAQSEYPLSFSQQRFWFLDRLETGNASLHIPAAISIKGELNITYLQEAFNLLIAQHESLRTTFILTEDKSALQKIHTPFSLPIKHSDLSEFNNDEQQHQLNILMHNEALNAFDLYQQEQTPSLMRTQLICLNKEHTHYVLLITLHHIIADGWSLQLLIKELTHYYQQLQNKKSINTLPPTLSYIDFSAWQHQCISLYTEKHLSYWKEQLKGVPLLELPCDFVRPKKTTHHGDSVQFTIDNALSKSITALAAEKQASTFILFIAAFNILLQRYTQQDDICIGTPVAGRNQPDLESIIGCFINMLAIRNTVDNQQAFTDFLQQVKNTLFSAQEHQDIPFELVAEACTEQRSLAHTPIFQVLFTQQASDIAKELQVDNLELSILPQPSVSAKYDLQLHIDTHEEGFSGTIEFNTDLFNRESIERISRHYTALLQAIINSPNNKIADLSFLSEDEYEQQMDMQKGWNATQFSYPPANSIQQLFEQQVSLTPDAIAIKDDEGELSYHALNTAANQLAHYLITLGIERNQPVAVYLDRSRFMSIALLGILKAGGAYVPLTTNLPASRVSYICNDTASKVLLTTRQTDISGLDITSTIVLVDQNEKWQTLSTENPKAHNEKDDLFNIIYTSGSTGNPKGVMVPHGGIINRLQWMQHAYPINQHSNVLQKTPFNFDVSVWELFWPLLEGSCLIYAKPNGHKDPEYLRQCIIDNNITTLHFVPSMLGVFLEHRGIEHCKTLQQVFASGEALQLQHAKVFFEKLPQAGLYNLYGPTEASVDVSFYDCTPNETHSSIAIGKPIHNIQLHILDSALNVLPIGVAGDLYIGGEGLARGYWKQESLTNAAFINNPYYSKGHPSKRLYKTGDIARYRNNGDIEYLGRSDDQVKIRGLRIELNEISERIKNYQGIKDALVINTKNAQTLIAYYIAEASSNIAIADVRHYLQQHLPEYMLPTAFVPIEAWPLSANGKINRKALPRALDEHTLKAAFVAPRNNTEQTLTDLWQEFLNIENIGIHDNFFELGGHSLMATQLSGKIAQLFTIELPLTVFFEKPTIAELSNEIDNGIDITDLENDTEITKSDRSQQLPLSFAQERLWIIEQVNPGNTAYNIPFAIKLSGTLNVSALKKALYAIIDRHETLRTMIKTASDGNAYQDIQASGAFILSESSLENHASNDIIEQHIAATTNKAFDFNTDILFRAELITINEQEHILAACMHHIISDGWSLSILQKELQALYNSYAKNLNIELPVLNYQYADFAAWQRAHINNEQAQQHLSYWLEQLKDAPAFITLPIDKVRPSQQTFNGAMLTAPLTQSLTHSISNYAQDNNTTFFNVLLSAYNILLSKYSRQDDICIGTPVSGRERSGLQQLIGYFVNAVVIRNKLQGNPNFNTVVESTQQTCLSAFAHQDVAIEQVLDQLPLERNPSYSPVAQVGFSFINKDLIADFSSDNLTIETLPTQNIVAKYDLTLIVIETSNGLQLNFEYNTDLFLASTIEAFSQHFIYLLEQCVEQPLTTVKGLQLFSQEQLFDALNVSAQDVESILPLTPMQYDMVMSQWLNPQSLANTLGYRAEINYDVDADTWQTAINTFSQRQPITRTQFKTNRLAYGDFAYQCMLKNTHCVLDIMDYRDENLSEQDIQQRVDAFIYQPSAYEKNQFIRYGLMRLNNNRTILLLSSHHALLDGISIVYIAESTARIYEALINQQSISDIELPATNFAHYVSSNIQAIDNTAALNFWQPRLAQCEALDFSVDANIKPQQLVKVHYLPEELWQSLKTYCRKNRTTPALFLKMVYSLLIANYCRTSDDFYISEFHAGRDKDTTKALGCFFLQSPFIFSHDLFAKETSISQLLAYARDFRKTIKPYDAISMGLTKQLAPQGRLHFMFNYYHFFPQDQCLMGNPITCIETPPFIEQTVQFVIKEHETNCQLDLYYNAASFNDYDLLQRIEFLSQQIIQGSNTLADLSLVFDDEREQQVNTWNNTAHDLPPFESVQQWFEKQVTLTPDNIAIIDDDASITYQALNTRANNIAHYLRAYGIKADTRVGLCMNRCIDALCVILGIIKAGGAYVPIDASYPQQRISYMLENADIGFLFTQTKHADLFTEFTGSIINIDDHSSAEYNAISQSPNNNPSHLQHSNDMLYVIFTSGSTGNPKGAIVTHAGELNLLQWYTEEFNYNESTNNLIISALGFDLTQKNLFAPLISGGKLILSALEHYDSGAIHQLIEKHAITHINCAPSAFYPLVEDHSNYHALSSLRTVIFGGEPIRCERLETWVFNSECHADIVNNYGPTECTDISAFYRVKDISQFKTTAMPIGKPNYNVQSYILNPLEQLLPAGLLGEICVSGKGVGRGYLNNPELTAAKFTDNPFGTNKIYHTGDIGRFTSDGNIIFHARQDFQIKLNGLRIELGEIEAVISKVFSTSDSLAIVDDGHIIAYYCDASLHTPDNWKATLASHLPSYMIPQALVVIKQWPLTPNGKIDRSALPKPCNTEVIVPYVPPSNDIEQVICDIVQRILNVDRVGIHDNFFDLGGHSLAASRAIVQIREHFELEIPLNVLFEMTTVEKLAGYIKASQWALQSASEHKADDESRDTGFI
jgi:amino acid adenylation domain-containing protein